MSFNFISVKFQKLVSLYYKTDNDFHFITIMPLNPKDNNISIFVIIIHMLPTITEQHIRILKILLLQIDYISLVTLPYSTPPLPHQFHYERLSKYFDEFNLNQYLINNVALQDYLIARISHVTNLLI